VNLLEEIKKENAWLREEPRAARDTVYSGLLDEGLAPAMASYFANSYEFPAKTNWGMLAADLGRTSTAQDYPELYFSKGGQLGTADTYGILDIELGPGALGGATIPEPPYDIFVKNDNSLLHEFGHKNSATLGEADLDWEKSIGQYTDRALTNDTRPVQRYLPGGSRSGQPGHSPWADLVMEDMTMPRGQRVWDKYPELFPTDKEKSAFLYHAYGKTPQMSADPRSWWERLFR
jgi:hypothetical protein